MSFAARENLKRTLQYRPHVRASFKALLIIAALGTVGVLGLSYMQFAEGHPDLATSILLGGILLPAILIFEAFFLARPMATARVHVRSDGITLERLGKVIEIHFSDVASVKFNHIPYLGGWFSLVLQNGESYRFTVVLERSEYILEAISAVRPGIVRSDDLLAYRRTAIMSDHSWARVYAKARNWQGITLKYFVLPALLTGVTLVFLRDDQNFLAPMAIAKLYALMVAINLSVGLALTFATSELILVIFGKEKLLKDPANVTRDMNFEKKVDSIALIGHWVMAFLILGLVIWRLHGA